MKVKLLSFLVVSVILIGCKTTDTPKEPAPEENEVVKEIDAENSESFSNDTYDSFPKVKNIVKYLKLKKEDVKVLKQTNKRIIFCFQEEFKDAHDETILSIENYARSLVKDNYEMDTTDGTVVSAIFLTKGDTFVKIISLTDIEGWKSDLTGEENQIYKTGITNQNTIVELSTKD